MGGRRKKKKTVGYRYFLGIHFVFCQGPVDYLMNLKCDGKDVIGGAAWTGGTRNEQLPQLFGGESREGGVGGNIDLMMGGSGQGANSYLSSQLGGTIPAFRGVVSIVLNRFYMGLNPYLKRWKARFRRIEVRQNGMAQWYLPKAPVPYAGHGLEGPHDMNPAHIIRECLTDPDWGMGYAESSIDDISFAAAADTLYDERMGISILWDKQILIEEFVKDIIRHIDATLFIDRDTGQFTLKLIRADFNVATALQLNEGNILKVEGVSRPTTGELINSVTVNTWDHSTGGNTSVTVQDQALIAMQGVTINTTIQYPGFSNRIIGSRVAMRDLRVLSSPLLKATIYANREAHQLNIGDVFLFTWPLLDIVGAVMRVTSMGFGDGRSNQIRIEAIEDAFSLPVSVPIGNPSVGWTNPSQPPNPVVHQLIVESPYYELVQQNGETDINNRLLTNPSLGFFAVAAARTAGAINGVLLTASGAGSYADVGNMDFCAFGTLVNDLEITGTTAILANVQDDNGFEVDSHLQIGDELCRIDGYDSATKTLTLGRGVLDTVPAKHLALSKVFCWDESYGSDEIEYADGELVRAKVLPVTPMGQLDEGVALASTLTLEKRAIRPYPPGNFKIDGVAYPLICGPGSAPVFTWSHRDRLAQTSGFLFDTTYGNIGPEPGVTYDLRIYDDVGTLVDSLLGTSGLTHTWTAPAGVEFDPVDLEFKKVSEHIFLSGMGYQLANEPFTTNSGQLTQLTFNNSGTMSFSAGALALAYANTGTDKSDVVVLNTYAGVAAPIVWVEVLLDDSGTASGYSNGGVGIAKDENNYLVVMFCRLTNEVKIHLCIAGSLTTVDSAAYTMSSGAALIGLSLVGNSVTLQVYDNGSWITCCGDDVQPTYDFRTTGNLTGWKPCTYSACSGGAVTWTFDDLRIGIPRGVGMEKLTAVTYETGNPYFITSNEAAFLATVRDPLGAKFAAVVKVLLETPYTLTVIGAIAVERSAKRHMDHDGHLIYYANGDRRLLITTWDTGATALDVLHKLETAQNLLSGLNVVTGMTTLSLPSGGASPGVYGPMMFWDTPNSRWQIAYTRTEYRTFSPYYTHPASAHSADLSTWTSLGFDTNNGYEGTKFLKANGSDWLLAGGPQGNAVGGKIYSAASVSYQGPIDAVLEGASTTIPNPMVFPYQGHQYLVTHDNQYNFLLYDAPRYHGYRVELEAKNADSDVSWQKHNHIFHLGY